jgi:hypothetical protein
MMAGTRGPAGSVSGRSYIFLYLFLREGLETSPPVPVSPLVTHVR